MVDGIPEEAFHEQESGGLMETQTVRKVQIESNVISHNRNHGILTLVQHTSRSKIILPKLSEVLFLSSPLIWILSAITNCRHISIHCTTSHAATFTTSTHRQHLRHPVRVHPAAHDHSCSAAFCIGSSTKYPLFLPFSLSIRMLLCP